MAPDLTSDRVDGATPNGGAYTVAVRDEAGEILEIWEFDENDEVVARTYATIKPPA